MDGELSVISEARRAPRRPALPGQGISVHVVAGDRSHPVELTDTSVGGMGMVLPAGIDFRAGMRIELECTGLGASHARLAAIVRHVRHVRPRDGTATGQQQIGVAFEANPVNGRSRPAQGSRDVVPDRRKGTRVAVATGAAVRATLASPVFWRESIPCTVTECAAGGLTLHASQHCDALLPGMQVDMTVTLPLAGSFRTRALIGSRTWDPDSPVVRLGVRFVAPDKSLLEAISEQILVDDTDRTPALLRSQGFTVGIIDRALTFTYATTQDDLDAVAKLRLAAHQKEGRLRRNTASDLQSSFDRHARIIVCRHGARIVGCWRMIFVDGDPQRSQYVSWGNHAVPRHIWLAGFLEAGAGAMDPDYQRSGMFVRLCQRALAVAVHGGYRYVTGASEPHLWPMYCDLGAEFLEERVVRPKEGWKFGWEFRSVLFHWDLDKLLVNPPTGKYVSEVADSVRFARAAHMPRTIEAGPDVASTTGALLQT